MQLKELQTNHLVLENYLKKHYDLENNNLNHDEIKIKEIIELGEGCHGIAFKVILQNDKTLILKQFKKDGRNMEFIEDRVKESLLIQRTANILDSHIKINDVCYLKKNESGEISSLNKFPCEEPIIIMDEIHNSDYFNDLFNISKKEELGETDKIRIKEIANYLAKMHSNKLPSNHYHRYLKEWYSYGILELSNELYSCFSSEKIFDLKKKFLEFEHILYLNKDRCSQIHGEFFPGTIHFDDDNTLKTYDMRRIGAGEPADDVGSILFNYLVFSIQSYKKITPIFLESSKLFLETYLDKTKDTQILDFLPVFMAYRCLILSNPQIVPMDDETRKLVQNFLLELLEMKKFDFNNLK